MRTKRVPRGPIHTHTSDEELVAQVRSQGVAGQIAFAALVRRYSAPISRRCRYRLGNVHDAQDVTQEVLLRIYRSLGTFRGQASFRTWLSAIVENECTTYAAKRSRYVLTEHLRSLIDLHEARMHKPHRSDEALAATVPDALARLAEPGRQVLYLRFYEDCSLAEIAHRLDISLSAAKMRLYRGLEQLRDRYRRERDTALKPGERRASSRAARSRGANVRRNTVDAAAFH